MRNKFTSQLIIVALIIIVVFLILPYFTHVDLPDVNMSSFGAGTVRARVTEIIEEGEIDLGGTIRRYQVARVELLGGKYRGIGMEMD